MVVCSILCWEKRKHFSLAILVVMIPYFILAEKDNKFVSKGSRPLKKSPVLRPYIWISFNRLAQYILKLMLLKLLWDAL